MLINEIIILLAFLYVNPIIKLYIPKRKVAKEIIQKNINSTDGV